MLVAQVKSPSRDTTFTDRSSADASESSRNGALIINADDWGRDAATTDSIMHCVERGAVSSASGMVFMEDSERSALIAREHSVDIGLHLNFTTQFSQPGCPENLKNHQQRLSTFLRRGRVAQALFHPRLSNSFQYLVAAQIEEFQRLYGVKLRRIDGHHHMHLCANVLFGNLLPPGIIVRRSFSFQASEKSAVNRLYRKTLDYFLARQHVLTDCFFSIAPIEPIGRLRRISDISRHAVVELETHPINPDEFRFLTSGDQFQRIFGFQVMRGYQWPALTRVAALQTI